MSDAQLDSWHAAFLITATLGAVVYGCAFIIKFI